MGMWEKGGEGERFALVEMLAGETGLVMMEVYHRVQGELYWKRKDVRGVVWVSEAGIVGGLAVARRTRNARESEALRSGVKRLAYDLGSFTWAGWAEEGIEIGEAERRAGLAGAELNVRLAEALRKPAKARANAWWLMGAQRLAGGEWRGAVEAFGRGRALAEVPGEEVMARMLEGYEEMGRVLGGEGERRATFERVVAWLRAEGSEDAGEFARQLEVAMGVFERGK